MDLKTDILTGVGANDDCSEFERVVDAGQRAVYSGVKVIGAKAVSRRLDPNDPSCYFHGSVCHMYGWPGSIQKYARLQYCELVSLIKISSNKFVSESIFWSLSDSNFVLHSSEYGTNRNGEVQNLFKLVSSYS